MIFLDFKNQKWYTKQLCVEYKVDLLVNIVINHFKDCMFLLMANYMLEANVNVVIG